MDETRLREQLCQAVGQLWTRGMIVGADGMVCAEVHRRRYLATPVGLRRIDLTPNDLICVDIGGENVQGGEGIPIKLWQPHRDIFQSRSDPADDVLRASALIEPPHIMALLASRDGVTELDLGLGAAVPVVEQDDDPALRQALQDATEAVLRGRGLLVASTDLAQTLNRIERIEMAASIQLATRRG